MVLKVSLDKTKRDPPLSVVGSLLLMNERSSLVKSNQFNLIFNMFLLRVKLLYHKTNYYVSFIKDPGYKARAGLGLEPSAFRWHYESRICHINKVFNLNRMHGECYLGIFVASPFKFLQASDSTNEVNPLISAKILDA